MGEIADVVRRLHADGADFETIIAVVETMEGGPKRKAAAPRATRLPKDWELPPEWMSWALTEFPGMPQQFAAAEAAKFKDFWLGKSGQNGTKNDWLATWRNWVRRAVEDRRGRQGVGKPQSAVEQRRQALAERVQHDHGIGRDRDRSAAPDGQLSLLGH